MNNNPSVGYNSHSSHLIPLDDIYESEFEKGNDHVVISIAYFLNTFKSVLHKLKEEFPDIPFSEKVMATWVTHDPIQCFREYVLPAEAYEYSDDVILKAYPDYMDYIYEVDLTGLIKILGDDNIGYVYVKI